MQPACAATNSCPKPNVSGSNASGSCYQHASITGANQSSCNPSHPIMSETQICEYGPAYSHLGKYCALCPHPNIVNDVRTTCTPCKVGEGPDKEHVNCLTCLDGTTSAFGVCQACPVGSTADTERSECIDINECDDNDGGCDLLATVDGVAPCFNEPFTGVGYRCGQCPDGKNIA